MALRPTSDLGLLMQSALEEYNETTGDLKKDYDQAMEARSIADVQAYVVDHADKFRKFRHNESRLDQFRTAVGQNLNQIQVMSDVLAGPATAAFPAAAPIFTAINFLVFTWNRVKSDFDNLLNFLEEVGSCMNSISIVEGFVHSGRQIPQLDVDFKNVFSAVLKLCGVSTKYISDGRFKRGLMRGFLSDDRGLSSAYATLQKAMVNLGRSIQNGTFAGVVVLTEGMAALEDQVAELDRLARETNQAAKDTKEIVTQTKDDMKDLRDAVKDQNMPDTRRIRIFFEGFAPWEAPFEERKRKFVDGTSEWLLKDDETYKTWFSEGDKKSWGRGLLSVLWIWGGTGTGKSILAFKAVDTLKSYAAEFRGVSVIYYFFPLEKKVSLKSALKSLIIQIADYDELYRQRIATLIKNSSQTKAEDVDTIAIWKTYIADQYVSGSARGKLHIVLDGIEELTPPDRKSLQEIVGQIILDKLNIKLLFFGQSELNDTFGKSGAAQVPHIEITPSRIDNAIKSFISDRVSKFQTTLDDSLKKEIIDTLSTDAGGFAFVDACLDEIETTEQVEDIPDVLTALPSTYKDLLKRVMNRILSDIQSKKNQGDRLNAIKIMLYWTAVAGRYLTVKELKCVIGLKTKYSNFNVVGEVRKTCSGLLWIPSEDSDGEDSLAETKVESHETENNNDHRLSHAVDDAFLINCLVKFREFRFEDCFKDVEWTTEVDNTLIENAAVARFQLAITSIQILSCPVSDPLYEVSRNLENFSASEWHVHVGVIDFQSTTDEQASQITKGIKNVFTTPETTSKALENQTFLMYDTFVSAKPLKDQEGKQPKDRGVVMEWCLNVQSVGPERLSLSTEEFAWVERVILHPPSLFESLIQEHVKHWLQVLDFFKADETFQFALSALRATGEFLAAPTESDIIQISQKCPDYPMDEIAYRAVGATLSVYNFNESALEYFLKAEGCSKTSAGKFYSLVGLGCSYYDVLKTEMGVEVLTRALLLEGEVVSQKSNQEYVNSLLRRAYQTLGRCLTESISDSSSEEAVGKAIHALQRATTFRPTTSYDTNVMIMNIIVGVFRQAKDSKGLVDQVISWDAELCGAWMLEDIEWLGRQLLAFRNAAEKEHRAKDIIASYKAAMEAMTEDGDALAIRVELASVYWKVLDDEDLAHDELSNIMDTTDSSLRSKTARHRASLLLSEMMYGQIKLAPMVWMKRILAANLATFSEKDTESKLDIWNIRPNISLASAYLSSNQPQEAVKLLDPTFSMCMEWLRDDVSWNDSTSLRLLAKLLECAGLHRDAMIAYSAGLSKLDSYAESEVASVASEELDKIVEPTDDPDVQGHDSSTSNKILGSAAKDALRDAPVDEKQLTDNKHPKFEETTTSNGDTAVQTEKPSGSNSDTESNTGEAASSKSDTEDIATENDLSHRIRVVPKGDEELASVSESSWTCDGEDCTKGFAYWVKDEPLYLCIICADIDLCKDCHAKRMTANEKSTPKARVPYCGMNHDYVSGPIEGWGGIKGGIITILPEKVEFKHWLKDVEEKWAEWKSPSSSKMLQTQKAEEVARAVERLNVDS